MWSSAKLKSIKADPYSALPPQRTPPRSRTPNRASAPVAAAPTPAPVAVPAAPHGVGYAVQRRMSGGYSVREREQPNAQPQFAAPPGGYSYPKRAPNSSPHQPPSFARTPSAAAPAPPPAPTPVAHGGHGHNPQRRMSGGYSVREREQAHPTHATPTAAARSTTPPGGYSLPKRAPNSSPQPPSSFASRTPPRSRTPNRAGTATSAPKDGGYAAQHVNGGYSGRETAATTAPAHRSTTPPGGNTLPKRLTTASPQPTSSRGAASNRAASGKKPQNQQNTPTPQQPPQQTSSTRSPSPSTRVTSTNNATSSSSGNHGSGANTNASNAVRPLVWLQRMIDEIYVARFKEIQMTKEGAVDPLRLLQPYGQGGEHGVGGPTAQHFALWVAEYLSKRFGLDNLIKQNSKDIVIACRHYSGVSVQVDTFRQFFVFAETTQSKSGYGDAVAHARLQFYLWCRHHALAVVPATNSTFMLQIQHTITVEGVAHTSTRRALSLQKVPIVVQHIKQLYGAQFDTTAFKEALSRATAQGSVGRKDEKEKGNEKDAKDKIPAGFVDIYVLLLTMLSVFDPSVSPTAPPPRPRRTAVNTTAAAVPTREGVEAGSASEKAEESTNVPSVLEAPPHAVRALMAEVIAEAGKSEAHQQHQQNSPHDSSMMSDGTESPSGSSCAEPSSANAFEAEKSPVVGCVEPMPNPVAPTPTVAPTARQLAAAAAERRALAATKGTAAALPSVGSTSVSAPRVETAVFVEIASTTTSPSAASATSPSAASSTSCCDARNLSSAEPEREEEAQAEAHVHAQAQAEAEQTEETEGEVVEGDAQVEEEAASPTMSLGADSSDMGQSESSPNAAASPQLGLKLFDPFTAGADDCSPRTYHRTQGWISTNKPTTQQHPPSDDEYHRIRVPTPTPSPTMAAAGTAAAQRIATDIRNGTYQQHVASQANNSTAQQQMQQQHPVVFDCTPSSSNAFTPAPATPTTIPTPIATVRDPPRQLGELRGPEAGWWLSQQGRGGAAASASSLSADSMSEGCASVHEDIMEAKMRSAEGRTSPWGREWQGWNSTHSIPQHHQSSSRKADEFANNFLAPPQVGGYVSPDCGGMSMTTGDDVDHITEADLRDLSPKMSHLPPVQWPPTPTVPLSTTASSTHNAKGSSLLLSGTIGGGDDSLLESPVGFRTDGGWIRGGAISPEVVVGGVIVDVDDLLSDTDSEGML